MMVAGQVVEDLYGYGSKVVLTVAEKGGCVLVARVRILDYGWVFGVFGFGVGS